MIGSVISIPLYRLGLAVAVLLTLLGPFYFSMAYQSTNELDLSQFNGSQQRLGDYGTGPNNALFSQNTSFNPGQVSKRLGHSVAFTIVSDGAALTLANWYFFFGATPAIVALFYTATTGIKGWQLTVGGFTGNLIPITGAAGASMVPTGMRLYAAFYDSTGRYAGGNGVASIYGWNIGYDPLFAAPMASTMIVAETGAGVVTAGVHKIAYLPTTRNGFTTKTSPVIAGVFTPTSFTSTGSKNLAVQVNGVPPTYMTGGSLQIVMTPVTNPNKFFTVPGATGLSSNGVIITFDIDDDDLQALGTDVTDQVNILTNTSTTAPYNPPFLPSAIFPYSNRMGYCTIDAASVPVVYMSDKNDFQRVTADQNGIYLEAHDKPVQGVSLGGVCYIGSPFCFYSCTDSGDAPVNWTPPQKVFGSVGILSPTCVSVDPSQTRALIASQQGLYLFRGGVFPELPISYNQKPDWDRIDWTRPTEVQVVEDQTKKKFIVIAPLVADLSADTDIAGAGTYEMSWDYTEGDEPFTVKYSINPYSSYQPRSLALIINYPNFILEAWTGPAGNGPVIRENDGSEAHPYRDVDMSGDAAAIAAYYETSIVPGETKGNRATIHDFHGAHFRVQGVGNMEIQANGIDNQVTKVPTRSPLPLSETPGEEELVKWFLRNEQQSIRFGNAIVDEWFTVSLIRAYWTNAMQMR